MMEKKTKQNMILIQHKHPDSWNEDMTSIFFAQEVLFLEGR